MSHPPGRSAHSSLSSAQAAGRWGEEVAVACLVREGYSILGRRVRPDRRDEIDIVARKDRTLVFVEVKARRTEAFGRPIESIDVAKRKALNRAAVRYLQQIGFPRMYYRFDTVEVVGSPDDAEPLVRHIENAFPFDRHYLLNV